MGDFGIGAAVRRKEDFRFLTGQGTYTDDINRPGQLYAFLLRSPHAHAELGAIDTAAANAAPGVSAVFTGADLQVGGLPCGWLVTSKDGKPMIEPPHPLLAQGKVRHVGDPVAVVVAETLEQAKDAAELIEVSYKTLPAVVTSQEAIKPGSPLLFDTAPGNLCFDWHLGDKTAVNAAFSRAHHIAR
jgi:carbon-monoxide dehydrogenase large subunit